MAVLLSSMIVSLAGRLNSLGHIAKRLRVGRNQIADDRCRSEIPRPDEPKPTKTFAPLRVVGDPYHCTVNVRHAHGIEVHGCVAGELADRGDVGRDDRTTTGLSLEHGDSSAFVE